MKGAFERTSNPSKRPCFPRHCFQKVERASLYSPGWVWDRNPKITQTNLKEEKSKKEPVFSKSEASKTCVWRVKSCKVKTKSFKLLQVSKLCNYVKKCQKFRQLIELAHIDWAREIRPPILWRHARESKGFLRAREP